MAIKVGRAIQKDVQHILVRELQKDDSTPDSAVDAAIQILEQQQVDRERKAEQTGADLPATKPADKVPAKDQPSTPTSKESPR